MVAVVNTNEMMANLIYLPGGVGGFDGDSISA